MPVSKGNFEAQMVTEIALKESLDPNAFYEAKRGSLLRARAMGFSDADIEAAFNVRLHPEDRA